MGCLETAPRRESFHCILAGKLCPTAVSPPPSVLAKLTMPEMQKQNIYWAWQLVCVWYWRKWITNDVCGGKKQAQCGIWITLQQPAPVFRRGLDSPERGWNSSREGGEHANSRAGRLGCLRERERRVGDRIHFFLAKGQKMNMSVRVVFGKGHSAPKQLSFTFPQAEPLKKDGRSAAGNKRMFSFSFRCRLGVIRGRTKDEASIYGFRLMEQSTWGLKVLFSCQFMCFLVSNSHQVIKLCLLVNLLFL